MQYISAQHWSGEARSCRAEGGQIVCDGVTVSVVSLTDGVAHGFCLPVTLNQDSLGNGYQIVTAGL